MANQWDEKTWKINIIAGKPAERISGPKIKGILGEIFEIFLVNSGVRRKSLPSPHGMFSYWAIQFKCFLSSRQVACRKGDVALNFFSFHLYYSFNGEPAHEAKVNFYVCQG